MKVMQILVAVILFAVFVGVALAQPPAAKQPRTCKAQSELTARQVERLCGKPDATYAAPPGPAGVQEEWRYGETYVGLINGKVWYVY